MRSSLLKSVFESHAGDHLGRATRDSQGPPVLLGVPSAGLQFNVPVGWEVEALSDRVRISKEEGKDSFIISTGSHFQIQSYRADLEAKELMLEQSSFRS